MRIAVIVFLAGCRFNLPTDPDAAPQRCEVSDEDCLCLDGVCVACTVDDTSRCSAAEKACGSDNKCRACSSNDHCPSGSACLENGTCAAPSNVIATSPDGVNTSPCGGAGQSTCSIMQALNEVSPLRDIIQLAPGMYTVPTNVDGLDFNTKSATLVARGAVISRVTASGAIMSARNGQTLKLIGGTLQGQSTAVDGLRCSTGGRLIVHETTIEGMLESGIKTYSCELTVSRSTLRDSREGGIHMADAPRMATITNNLIYRNGRINSSLVGGMILKLAAGSKVEFNTVVDNTVALTNGLAGGVQCEGTYDAPYNLIYRNRGGLDGMVQVIGTCTFSGSYAMAATGAANDVGFENPNATSDPSYRLTQASPLNIIRNAFDCRDVVDFDGQQRPQGGKCDYGADEFAEGP